jgi:hypothetical protein
MGPELLKAIQDLLSDINSMRAFPYGNDPKEHPKEQYWFGPFSENIVDVEYDVSIEWPNLLISAKKVESLLAEENDNVHTTDG